MNGIIQCDLLCLASFTQHKLFKVQPFLFYIYTHTHTQFIYFIFGCAGSGFSLVVVSGGYPLLEVHEGILFAEASLVAEHRLSTCGARA